MYDGQVLSTSMHPNRFIHFDSHLHDATMSANYTIQHAATCSTTRTTQSKTCGSTGIGARLAKLVPELTKVSRNVTAVSISSALHPYLLDQSLAHIGRGSKEAQGLRPVAFHQGRPLPAAKSPYIAPLSISLWNTRSLCKVKDNRHGTLHAARNIISAHTLTVLAENRTTVDSITAHASILPHMHKHFFSHHYAHTAGTSIHVARSFIDLCTSISIFAPVSGYTLIIQCDTPRGSIDIVALYLDSKSPGHRIRIMQAVLPYIRHLAHTI